MVAMLDFPTRSWRNGWLKPDRRPIWEWAADHVVLPPAYAVDGRFSVETSRHMLEPLAAIQDPLVREVSLAGAIQTGKTLIVELAQLWAMVNEPGPGMWTLQTDQDAKEHWKQRFLALMRACPVVEQMLPKGYDLATGSIYFGPYFWMVNGANINNLQRVSIRWKFNSEVWLWKAGLLDHARGRVTAFDRAGTSKVVNESQGGTKGDDFDRAWQSGHQAVWSIRCEGCRQWVPLTFFAKMADDPLRYAGVTWDDAARTERGDWNVQRVAETARFRCRLCGHDHADTPRTHTLWNAEGRYLAGRDDAPAHIRSYRWEALVSRDIATLAAQWAEASNQKHRGLYQGIADFIRQRCALPWEESSADFDEQVEVTGSGYTLAEVAKDPAAKIEGEKYRFATIDRQRDHFWALVRAWRADGSSRLLWCGKLLTIEDCQAIAQRFLVPSRMVFEDAQHATSDVYNDCIRYGWTALHGSGQGSFWHDLPNKARVARFWSPVRYAQVSGSVARYIHWSSDPVKDVLHRLYCGRGVAFETPDDAPEYYRQHMQAERKVERVNKTSGQIELRWFRRSGSPNHLRDCEAMQVAAALMLKLIGVEKHDLETATTE
jgi:hypothetical protein